MSKFNKYIIKKQFNYFIDNKNSFDTQFHDVVVPSGTLLNFVLLRLCMERHFGKYWCYAPHLLCYQQRTKE